MYNNYRLWKTLLRKKEFFSGKDWCFLFAMQNKLEPDQKKKQVLFLQA